MEITSYLLGKKSSGGGGGSGGLDWTALGYSGTPQALQEDYDYSLQIKNNWNGSKLTSDIKLVYMPLVDCSNITDASQFFYSCSYLHYVPALNMTSVTNCNNMFYGCAFLTKLDLKNFKTENVTRMDNMFNGCSRLKELDLSSFYTSSLTRVQSMFSGCTSLEKIDMRNFSFSRVTTSGYYANMFANVSNDCLIIVKDNTEKSWITTKFTSLTNVKTVEEYEAM